MKAKWKWMLWIAGALLLAIIASVVFIENRGGHYPIYKASSFSNLALPAASTVSTGEPVAQIGAGTLRGTIIGSAIAFLVFTLRVTPTRVTAALVASIPLKTCQTLPAACLVSGIAKAFVSLAQTC